MTTSWRLGRSARRRAKTTSSSPYSRIWLLANVIAWVERYSWKKEGSKSVVSGTGELEEEDVGKVMVIESGSMTQKV